MVVRLSGTDRSKCYNFTKQKVKPGEVMIIVLILLYKPGEVGGAGVPGADISDFTFSFTSDRQSLRV